MKRSRMLDRLRTAALLITPLLACEAAQPTVLRPHLAFILTGDDNFAAARDLTVAPDGSIFIFDYDDYIIRKFDPAGTLLAAFGGTGEEPGLFRHLMAIRILGDSLVALDEGSVSVFDLDGELRSRRPFSDTVVGDYPRVHRDGRWAAEWFVEESAEQVLTYRNADGTERARLVSLSLFDDFGVTPGETFFINRTQAPAYLYDFLPHGDLVWMISDRLRVTVRTGGADEWIFEAPATPVPYPEAEIRTLEARRARLPAPLFMNVPRHYQVAHHLVVDATGNLWVYVMSEERTGFLRLSAAGAETGFWPMEAYFDPLSARVAAANGGLYFLAPGREETAVYFVGFP